LELLKKLMAFEPLNSFNLVGGTALALQFGHRISIDLDLFSFQPFETEKLKLSIEEFSENENYSLEWTVVEDVTLIGTINGIKIDIIRYPYDLIDDVIVQENIRLLSTKDIAPMKLSAIAQRGSKKDFFDFYELLKIYSLDEMLGFYQEKIPHTDTTFLLRSLTYFDDAEIQEAPIMISNYNWEQVKKEITKKTKQYIEKRL